MISDFKIPVLSFQLKERVSYKGGVASPALTTLQLSENGVEGCISQSLVLSEDHKILFASITWLLLRQMNS